MYQGCLHFHYLLFQIKSSACWANGNLMKFYINPMQWREWFQRHLIHFNWKVYVPPMAVCLYLNGEGSGSASGRETTPSHWVGHCCSVVYFALGMDIIVGTSSIWSNPEISTLLCKMGTVQAADPTVYTASALPTPTSACWQLLVSGCSLSRYPAACPYLRAVTWAC